MHNSSPILGASFRRQHSSPTKKRRSSFSDVIASASTQQEASKPKPTIPIKRANSNHSGDESYIEEVIVDDDSYYEEVLIEEEFYEEEIIEIMNELKLPERDITIKFEDFDEMQTTLHINDYSPGEVEKSWYCRADYDRMVQKARSTIAKVEAKEAKRSKSDDKKREKDTKSSEFSQEMTPSNNGEKKKVLETRGLEGWSTEGAKKVRELKEKALEAVWNEQNRQWTTGDFDKEKVRAAYLTISAGAQAIAEERAAADQESAEKIHNKDLKRKKTDVRGMMKMGKSMLGKSMKGGLIKAKKQVSKVSHNSKRIEEIEQRQIIRQPSQGSRLLLDHLDGESAPY